MREIDLELNNIEVDPMTVGYSIIDAKFVSSSDSIEVKYSDFSQENVTTNSNIIAALDKDSLTGTSDEIGYIALNSGETFSTLLFDEFRKRATPML